MQVRNFPQLMFAPAGEVLTVLNGGEQKFLSSYKSTQNKTMPMYNFPKRDAAKFSAPSFYWSTTLNALGGGAGKISSIYKDSIHLNF